jgi:hypothetical protein
VGFAVAATVGVADLAGRTVGGPGGVATTVGVVVVATDVADGATAVLDGTATVVGIDVGTDVGTDVDVGTGFGALLHPARNKAASSISTSFIIQILPYDSDFP